MSTLVAGDQASPPLSCALCGTCFLSPLNCRRCEQQHYLLAAYFNKEVEEVVGTSDEADSLAQMVM
ncbi:hypothetical protein HaLaN_14576, partial [Haematococcus lacustris]